MSTIDGSSYVFKTEQGLGPAPDNEPVTGKIDINQSLSDKGLARIVHVDCDDNAFILKGLDEMDVRIPKKELIKAISKLM